MKMATKSGKEIVLCFHSYCRSNFYCFIFCRNRDTDNHSVNDDEIPDEDIELQLAMMASMDDSGARQQNHQENRE